MNLPFTRDQFFEVFARYNEGVMPLQLALFLLALSAFGAMVIRRRGSDRVVSAILAGLWAWMGIVYHFIYLIGGQAAFLLGVPEDLGLLLAGPAGLWLAFDRSRERRPA